MEGLPTRQPLEGHYSSGHSLDHKMQTNWCTGQHIVQEASFKAPRMHEVLNLSDVMIRETFKEVQMPRREQQEVSKSEFEGVAESHSEEVFSGYKSTAVPSFYGCLAHPAEIVEAASLAAQALPDASYNLKSSMPEKAFAEGLLSDLQIEGVLFACQRHQMLLPDGSRAGFFLADGTGVGKGRQISGIILDNLCRGRSKHIWFSISSDLRHDAERDLKDIGCHAKVIDGCQELDKETRAFGLVSDCQEGVLFSTYSTLVSSIQKGSSSHTKSSRLDQLIKWCGSGFDGCLIFDECHKAKHFVPGKVKASTKVAVAVTTIQRLLPKARVVYCSATGVTDVKNMAFMERLGLWGSGTIFKDFDVFHDSLTNRGLGALEMLSMEMKAAGMYVSRGLSYKDAEFLTVEAELTEDQVQLYNKAVHLWKDLKKCLTHALSRTNTSVSRIWAQYWGCHQRFFKQLCMSMKVPCIVREAKNALEQGHAVVIGLQTTGEASLDAEMSANDGKVDGFVSLTKEIFKRFVLQFFPTEVQLPGETKVDDRCVQAKLMLLDAADKLALPYSPLDQMIDELGGPDSVAEMTGRRGLIGRLRKSDKPSYHLRGATAHNVESLNVSERNSFMNGSKLIAIISDAASTGISLHADGRAANQRRRVHITAELPWSADKAVQQLGRSHRSNQTSGPLYKLVTSNLGGEKRFAAAVAKRLQSLGALTKGDRRAATGADLTQFNFDSTYGRQALQKMYDAITRRHLFGGVDIANVLAPVKLTRQITIEEFHDNMLICLTEMDVVEKNTVGAAIVEKFSTDVAKFLNRILGLEVRQQNMIFSYFSQCLDAVTEAAKREGRYNHGVSDIRGSSVVLVSEPKLVFKEAQLGASTTRHVEIAVDRGVPWADALFKYQQVQGGENGFYRSKRDQYGRPLFLLAIQKELSRHLFTIIRPNTGLSPFEEERGDLLQKYVYVEPADAELGWKNQYKNTKDGCIHGKNCKLSSVCRIGCRLTQIHLLTGRILSILPYLETMIAKYGNALDLPREYKSLRTVRVELDSGQRLVGLRYPESLLSETERFITEQKRMMERATAERQDAVIEAETPVNLKLKTKALSQPVTIKNFFELSAKKSSLKAGEEEATGYERHPRPDPDSGSCLDTSPSPSLCAEDAPKRKNLGLKRSHCEPSSGNSVKKPRKQGNIFSMITKSVESKDAKRLRTCPVCQATFPASLSNKEVNCHIDNCLID